VAVDVSIRERRTTKEAREIVLKAVLNGQGARHRGTEWQVANAFGKRRGDDGGAEAISSERRVVEERESDA